jgi:hypothetical protein
MPALPSRECQPSKTQSRRLESANSAKQSGRAGSGSRKRQAACIAAALEIRCIRSRRMPARPPRRGPHHLRQLLQGRYRIGDLGPKVFHSACCCEARTGPKAKHVAGAGAAQPRLPRRTAARASRTGLAAAAAAGGACGSRKRRARDASARWLHAALGTCVAWGTTPAAPHAAERRRSCSCAKWPGEVFWFGGREEQRAAPPV